MKAVIVYYSLSGDTDMLAKRLAERLGANLHRLELVRNPPKARALRMLWGGFMRIRGAKPALKNGKLDLAGYDTVVVASPVWASGYAAPIATFLSETELKGKRIGLLASLMSSGAEAFFEDLEKAMPGNTIVARQQFIAPQKQDAEQLNGKLAEFAAALSE